VKAVQDLAAPSARRNQLFVREAGPNARRNITQGVAVGGHGRRSRAICGTQRRWPAPLRLEPNLSGT